MLASNKNKILLKTLIIISIFIGIISTKSLAVVKPTNDFYVNDYANLLSTETKNYIMNANISLNRQIGAQIVVVTVPNLGGDTLEDYATKLFREFGIGDKTKNNGVLLLLALEERQFRVEVGYGLEGTLTDGKTGRIQDQYIIPYLKQNNWNEGIKNGFSAILKEVEEEYNINAGSEEVVKVTSNKNTYNNNNKSSLIFIILPVLSSIIGGVVRIGKPNNKKKLQISVIYFIILITFLYMYVGISVNINGRERLISTLILCGFDYLFFLIALFGRNSRQWWIFWWTADFPAVEAVSLAVEVSQEAEALLAEAEAREVFKLKNKNIYLKETTKNSLLQKYIFFYIYRQK